MNILHVIQSMLPANGGPCQGIRNLEGAMHHMGISREVVCLDSPDSGYLIHDKIKIHAIGEGMSPWHYNANLIPWLNANIERFDFVIINGLWSYHSYATWKVIHKLKLKNSGAVLPRVFVMPHGMLDPYFQVAKERKLKAVRNYIYWGLIENAVINDADGVLFTCETEMQLASGTFKNYYPKKEINVGYGIASPPVYTQSMSTAFKNSCPELEDSPYLLFLSRIHRKKGVDLLINAYISLRKFKVFSTRAVPKLVIAGPGLDSKYGKKLKSELDKYPEMKSEIFFPGMLIDEAKWGAFYGCDAFVLPSHQENFGIAMVEALACSKPVLISNQVNIWREVLTSGSGIVEEDTLKGARTMLIKWFELTDAERHKMNKNAFDAFKNFFDINKIAVNFLKVFGQEA
jgi:glycosyltransferase involved in cell wall biosynthesis